MTDDLTAAAPDEDASRRRGVRLGPRAWQLHVNETTPPPGYGGASQTNVTAVAVNGTNCVANKPTAANSAVFTNPPLGEITVGYHDLGSGETSATSITCAPSGGANISPQAATDDDDIPNYLEAQAFTFNPVTAPATYICTLVVDP